MGEAMMMTWIWGAFLAAAATPMPVVIVGGDKPDPFFTYTLPVVGALIGLLGLIISVVAVVLIWLQIRRADVAIAKADEQIEWAKRDFEFTQRSVALSQNALRFAEEAAEREAVERAKSPRLALKFATGGTAEVSGNTLTYYSNTAPMNFWVELFVANDGQRDATTVSVRLALSDGLTFERHNLQTPSLVRETTPTDATYVLQDAVLKNNGLSVFIGKPLLTATTWGEYDLHYRIESNEGAWPHNADVPVEERGRLHIVLSPSIPRR